jgi:hypothetical protein
VPEISDKIMPSLAGQEIPDSFKNKTKNISIGIRVVNLTISQFLRLLTFGVRKNISERDIAESNESNIPITSVWTPSELCEIATIPIVANINITIVVKSSALLFDKDTIK